MRGVYYLRYQGNEFKVRGRLEDGIKLLKILGEGVLVVL